MRVMDFMIAHDLVLGTLLGLRLAGCGDRHDAISSALAESHRRAASGDAAAQLGLRLRYVTGTDIAPDEHTALDWIGWATVQGNAAAPFELGSFTPWVPRRDYGRAADGLRRSALQGFAPAQTRLAMLYLAGGRGQGSGRGRRLAVAGPSEAWSSAIRRSWAKSRRWRRPLPAGSQPDSSESRVRADRA